MNKRYFLNASVKLLATKEKPLNICEVGAEVNAEFIINLNALYSSIVMFCVKKLGTSRLNLVSIKLMPKGDQIEITANVLLLDDEKQKFANEKDRYKPVKFIADKNHFRDLDVHRLFKYMEAKARQKNSSEFESLVHVRVIPCDDNDLTEKQF